jgi:hypothetical protein
MSNDRYARYGAASGIIAIVLILIGYSVATQDIPDVSASADDWASYYSANQNQIQTGLTLVGVGLFFYIWFLGSVRSALALAEGGNGRLASVAYGGGLISAAFFVVAVSATAAAAFRPDEIDPTITRALSDLGIVVGAPAAAGFTALFAATAIVGYRYNAVPAPVAGFSALAAVTQPLALGVALTDSGAFAADGLLGLWVPIVTFALAVLTLSGTLMRQPTAASAGGRPAAGPQ